MICLREVEVQAAANPAPRRILGPISLELVESRIAVIGANGSGKSTLVRLLNGLVAAASGQVLVAGEDVARRGAKVRTRVAMLFSDPGAQLIMPTAAEDVALSLRKLVKDPAERRQRVQEALDAVGLGTKLDVSVHQLSGGQRQLLALAGVLALKPQVLILDEPTTLLDLRWRAEVDRVISGLAGTTVAQVIEVTHDLEAAARAQRLLVIERGQLFFDGEPGEGIARYQELMSHADPAAKSRLADTCPGTGEPN